MASLLKSFREPTPTEHAIYYRYIVALRDRIPDEVLIPEMTRDLAQDKAQEAFLALCNKPKFSRADVKREKGRSIGWLQIYLCDLMDKGLDEPRAIDLLEQAMVAWDDRLSTLIAGYAHSAGASNRPC